MTRLRAMLDRFRAKTDIDPALRALAQSLFHADYYLSQLKNPSAVADPLDHYLRKGWRQGLDPHESFSTRFYLQANRDVRASGANPFLHFLARGHRENRPGLPFCDIPLDDLQNPQAYAAWRARWTQARRLMSRLRPARPAGTRFTVVLLPGAGAGASLASLAAQDDAPVEILCARSNAPAFSAAAAAGWQGAFVFFLESGATLDPDFFTQLDALVDATRARTGALPALLTADHDVIDASGALRTPTFLHGWDPDWQQATGARAGPILFGRDLLIETLRATAPASVDDLVQALAARPDWIASAHLAGPRLHLPDTALRPRPRPHPAPCANNDDATVSIIIPNKDRPDLLDACCRFLAAPHGRKIEVIIVDNASTDPALPALYDLLRENLGARIVPMNEAFNYARMINRGVAASTGELLVLLNNDVVLPDLAALWALCAAAARPEVGLAGCVLAYPDGGLQHAGMVFSTWPDGRPALSGHAWRHAPISPGRPSDPWNAPRNWQAVTGAVHCCRRSVFEAVGGYDEENLPIEYNDVDFSLRIRQSRLRVLCLPLPGVIHDESATRKNQDAQEADVARHAAQTLMQTRWPNAFAHDPYANACLSIAERWPPRVRDLQTRRRGES